MIQEPVLILTQTMTGEKMGDLEYKELYREERAGNYGKFGIVILVAASKLPDLKEDKIRSSSYEASNMILNEIQAAIISHDPKSKEAAKREKYELLSLFGNKVFAEEIPNGYCSLWCCRNLPWFIVTTTIGRFKIGWRKRVIHIEWTDTIGTKTAEELFPKEKVTKGDKYIHAGGIETARRYINTITEDAMRIKENLPIGQYEHKYLGIVSINEECIEMQSNNTDNSSIFVINEGGEMVEVTNSLLR